MENVGKRLAGLNATGMDIAYAEDSRKINYIVAKDVRAVSLNINNIGKALYDIDKTKEGWIKERAKDIEAFKKKYPYLEPYMNINSTDAQEFTTWREHLLIMRDRALLSEEQYKDIESKLSSNEELDAKELKMVMNLYILGMYIIQIKKVLLLF